MKGTLVEKFPIEKIKLAKKNPRVDLKPGSPEYEDIKRSLLKFGQAEPLVWNKHSGRLVGGHQRLKVIKELGWKTVKMSIVDIKDEKEEMALIVGLNKIRGEWEYGTLREVLSELKMGDLDTELTGFGKDELDDLLTIKTPPDDLKVTDPDTENTLITIRIKKDAFGLIEKHIEAIRGTGAEIDIS